MLPLITAPAYVLNNAGSGILSIAATPFDAVANEFIYVSVSYEVANPTIGVDHNGPYAGFNSLTKQHDAGDIKGHQEFWIQTNAPRKALTITARFSTGVGFAAIYVERRKALGTVTLIGQGTPTTGTASSSVTVPAMTGGDLHMAAIKAFGSFTFSTTNNVPFPLGTSDNSSRSHQVVSSNTPFSGTLTPATATLSSAQNWLCTSASFADSGSPVAATNVPSWAALAKGGTCIAIPGASHLASGAAVNNGGGALDSSKIFTDWGGGALCDANYYVGTEQQLGSALVITGSGHTTGGNSVHALGPFQSEYPGWNRLRDDTSPIPTDIEFDGSNNPSAYHSYDTLNHTTVGGVNRLIAIGGKARYSDAGDITAPHWFNLDQSVPNGGTTPRGKSSTTTGGWFWAVYDTGTAKFWGVANSGGSDIRSYDPATDTYSNAYGTKTGPTLTQPTVAACDQSRGIIVNSNAGNTFVFFRPSTAASSDFYTPSTTGTAPTTVSAVQWDPVDDRFVFYTGSNTWFFLTPPATSPYQGGNSWTWSSEIFTGDTIDAAQAVGTYGRMQIVQIGAMRFYVVVNSQTSRAYAVFPRTAIRGTQSRITRANFPKPNLRD